MTEILQKNGPEYKKYTIKDTGVYLEVKTNDNFTGKLVKFEHIGFEEILVKHKPSAYVTGLFVSVMFNVLFFILFIIDSVQEAGIDPNILFGAVIGALIPLGIWGRSVFKNEKEKILKGQENLGFYYFRKNEQEVDQFIASLKFKQREFIRNKYMQLDDLTPAENQKGILYWLFDSEFIDRQELQDLLDRLDKKVVIRGF